MKSKRLVMLSSLLVLTTFIICVSVYAYNAYCSKSVSNNKLEIKSSMNNTGLDNGYYSVHARVGPPPGTTLKNPYGNQDISLSLKASGSISQYGYGSAYVDGINVVNTFCSKFDSVTHP